MKASFRFRILVILGGLVVVIWIFLVMHREPQPPDIFYYTLTGDTNRVAQWLAQGTNVNAPVLCSNDGVTTTTLLHVAAQQGQQEVVEILLKHGADPNLLNSMGYTPLGCAINLSDTPRGLLILQMLLKAGADPNVRFPTGGLRTPLICAAYGGDSNSVRVLLAAGADIQATNSDGLTAIHYARNADVAALLITAGADPAARLGGETPAETATRLGHFSALAVITNAPAQTKETRQ